MIFQHIAESFSDIEQLSSRLSITTLLADLFSRVSDKEIQPLCYMLLGRVGPLFEPREFGMADNFVIRAIALSCNKDINEVKSTFQSEGDLGLTVQKLKKDSVHTANTVELLDVYTSLRELTDIGGEGSQELKIQTLADLISRLDSRSATYVARIPLGKMRLGVSDMTILDALSWMLSGDKSYREKLESAYNVRPDIGFIAHIVKTKGIDSLSSVQPVIGAPILPCLCQRVPTFAEMIEKMGEVIVEPKYDGVRVQIHFERHSSSDKKGIHVVTYSRNLEVTTDMFPELQRIGDYISADSCILDSEAVGIDPVYGTILPFQQTTTRKRKHEIASALQQVPLRFYVFDVMYTEHKSLLFEPLSSRRKILENIIKPNSLLTLSPYITTSDPETIRSYHEEQRSKGLEGIVVKKLHAAYEPGRKGYTWVKLKEEEGTTGKLADTIDTVVMGYYFGEGKRTGFGMGAFLVGVKRGDQFVTVCKIGTGISDDQMKELKQVFDLEKSGSKPSRYADVHQTLIPDVWIQPTVVVEIAGDDITRSPNHGAGYAIRFPRLIRVRKDKSPDQATTVEEIKSML